MGKFLLSCLFLLSYWQIANAVDTSIKITTQASQLSEDEIIQRIIEVDPKAGGSALDIIHSERISSGLCLTTIPTDPKILIQLPEFDLRGAKINLVREPIIDSAPSTNSLGVPIFLEPGERVKALCQKGAFVLVFTPNLPLNQTSFGWLRFGVLYTPEDAVNRGLNPEDVIWQEDKVLFRDKILRAINTIYKNEPICREYIDPRKLYNATSVHKNYITYGIFCGKGKNQQRVIFKLDGSVVEYRSGLDY